MAIFAPRNKNRRRVRLAGGGGPAGRTLTAGLAALPLAALCAWTATAPAWADTTGETNVSGARVLQALVNVGGLTDGTNNVDLTNVRFTYIQNDYMAVVVGLSGSYTLNSVTRNVAGRISFGNIGGNLRGTADNLQPLNGLDPGVSRVQPSGRGVWPLPNSYLTTNNGFQNADFPAYVRAAVDAQIVNGQLVLNTGNNNGGTAGQIVNVGFDAANVISPPTFRNNAINAEYQIIAGTGNNNGGGNNGGGNTTGATGVTLRQEIRLFRNTARLRWTLANYDTIPHTVYLRFAVNNRGTASDFVPGQPPRGYFFVDPTTGTVPTRPVVYGLNPDNAPQQSIPATIEVLGARYQDQNAATGAAAPFFSRQYFSDVNGTAPGATRPLSVFVTDTVELSPDSGTAIAGAFTPTPSAQADDIVTGVATGAIYGPFTLRAGTAAAPTLSTPITTYYGNGSSTDVLTPDFVIATEAEEALQFNSAAADPANRPALTSTNYADVVKSFLTPSQLTIYASLYNQQLDNLTNSVDLRNASVSVNLPRGLRLANDASGNATPATKLIGTVTSDRDGVVNFPVEATGETFGTLVYQTAFSVSDPSPLSRSISRAITVPATPLYPVTRNAFQGIGFPFEFDPVLSNGGDRDTVLFGITGRPTAAEPGGFFGWDAITQRYIRDVTRLETGRGYFYKPPTDRVVLARGVRPLPGQAPVTGIATNYYQTTLEAGWNFISNPYLYDVPANSLRFATIAPGDPNSNLNQVSFQQAVTSGIVRGSIYFWNLNLNNGLGDWDYLTGSDAILRPWQGYWVYLNDRRVLRIVPPSQPQSAILPDATGAEQASRSKRPFSNTGAIEKGRALNADARMDNWKLQLAARSKDDSVSASTFVGVSPQAKDGDDVRDMPKPPAMAEGSGLDVSLVRTANEAKTGEPTRLMQELKSPGGTRTWRLQVASEKGGPVTLSWPNAAQLPRGLRLVLKDEQTGRAVVLRGTSSVTVNVPAGRASDFTLTASRQLSRPFALNGLRVERGAGDSRAAGGGRSYSFALTSTADATVRGRVTTLGGQTLAEFETGRAVSGSLTRLHWNGRAQNGAPLPAGTYLVEVTGESEGGERQTVKAPLLILR
jgi:hypothetical protein